MSDPKRAWVIGSPIRHSLSPAIFRFLAHREGRALDYQAREVTRESLPEFLSALREDAHALGANVTLPLKEAVVTQLDQLSPEATAIGAVNVILAEVGHLTGYNTDVLGIQATLDEHAPALSGAKCLIFGAGGSAQALAYALATRGAGEIWFYNPRSDRGAVLAAKLRNEWCAKFPHTQFKATAHLRDVEESVFSLVANTTPVGMSGPSASDTTGLFTGLSEARFTADALAFDLIYTPEHTPFLAAAQARGLAIVGGLAMLVDQALATRELWLGPISDRPAIREGLLDLLRGILRLRRDPRPVFLTGFMAAGKSVVAQEFAALTGRTFIDTDAWIEKEAGMKISEIFRSQGEAAFRDLESRAVEVATQTSQSVVSLGGGALTRPMNLQRVQEHGILVYLQATPETLTARLQQNGWNTRPLLAGADGRELVMRVEQLLGDRQTLYQQASITLETDALDPAGVAQALLGRLKGIVCPESN